MLVLVADTRDLTDIIVDICQAGWQVKKILKSINVIHVMGDASSSDLLKIAGVKGAEPEMQRQIYSNAWSCDDAS